MSTEDSGVLFLSGGVATLALDDSVKIQQLTVVESFGLLIARCEKGLLKIMLLSSIASCEFGW